MELLDAITAELRVTSTKCQIAAALGTLTDAQGEDLRTALADPHYSASAISRALLGFDVKIRPAVIQHHRRGDCRCG